MLSTVNCHYCYRTHDVTVCP